MLVKNLKTNFTLSNTNECTAIIFPKTVVTLSNKTEHYVSDNAFHFACFWKIKIGKTQTIVKYKFSKVQCLKKQALFFSVKVQNIAVVHLQETTVIIKNISTKNKGWDF